MEEILNNKTRKVNIYLKNKLIKTIDFDLYDYNIESNSHYFRLDGKNVAIIPSNYLIIFDNQC